MQQKRQFALQRQQLARQTAADKHQAKLRPFELKQAQATDLLRQQQMQMRGKYPETVKGLPISEEMKAHLLTMTPEAGGKVIAAHLGKMLNRTKMIKAGEPTSDGQTYSVDLQQKDDGTLIKSPVPRKMITIGPGAVIPGTDIKNTYPYALEFDPVQGTFKAPLGTSAPKELITIQPGGSFPNGTVHTGLTAIQFNPVTKTITTPFGTTAQKKIIPLPQDDRRRDDYPNWQQDHLQLDMTYGGEGQVFVPDSAKTAPKNLVPVPKDDPRLKNYFPDEHASLKLDKNNDQIVQDPGFTLHEKMINVPAGGVYPDGFTVNNLKVPVQVNRSGAASTPEGKAPQEEFAPVPWQDTRLDNYPTALHKYLRINKKNNELSFPPSFTKELQERALALEAPSRSELFKTKHAPSQYANIQALGDLAEVAGNTLNGQRIAAVQLLPKDHKVARRALDTLNEAKVKMGKNGVFVPASVGKDYSGRGKRPISQSEPQSIPVLQGNTLDQIIQSFKAKGITVNPSQVIAANKHFFPEGDPNKMMTSAQVGNAEMLIPVGGGSLNETQVNAAHRSNDPRHNTTIIEGIGTYTNFNTATVPFAYKLNSDLADMKKLQSNVDQVVELMKDPNAISLMKTGHPARGLIEGLRWRLINNVQTLRDFGVLSPSEIDTIAKSVPDPNSFFNIVAGKAGLKPGRFIEGVLGALKKEGETKASQLRAFMNQYSVQEVDFKIHQYDPYEGQDNQNQNLNQQLDNELSSFE